MDPKLIEEPLVKEIYGVNTVKGKAPGPLWDIIKKENFPHAGINYFVWENTVNVFCGVEKKAPVEFKTELTKRELRIERYAYIKHIGPYQTIGRSYDLVNAFIRKNGLKESNGSIEIYGHWNPDETKLETEILIPVR